MIAGCAREGAILKMLDYPTWEKNYGLKKESSFLSLSHGLCSAIAPSTRPFVSAKLNKKGRVKRVGHGEHVRSGA